MRMPFFDLLNNSFKTRLNPFIKHRVNGLIGFVLELGKVVIFEIELNIASGGNIPGKSQGFGMITEVFHHLCG